MQEAARGVCELVSGSVGLLTGWEVRGREHVPRSGSVIVASNHVSFWDPPMVGAATRRELHFLAKSELFRIPRVTSTSVRRSLSDVRWAMT